MITSCGTKRNHGSRSVCPGLVSGLSLVLDGGSTSPPPPAAASTVQRRSKWKAAALVSRARIARIVDEIAE